MSFVKWLVPSLLLSSVALAEPPPNQMSIEWELLTAMLSSGINNGYGNPCDDAKQPVKTLVFVVEGAKHKKAETRLACPKGQNRNELVIKLPDDGGPYSLRVTSPDRPKLKSEHVKGFQRNDTVHVRIYAAGCDASGCE
jgi:hypothetical protein